VSPGVYLRRNILVKNGEELSSTFKYLCTKFFTGVSEKERKNETNKEYERTNMTEFIQQN
jgi:hypothetical protein